MGMLRLSAAIKPVATVLLTEGWGRRCVPRLPVLPICMAGPASGRANASIRPRDMAPSARDGAGQRIFEARAQLCELHLGRAGILQPGRAGCPYFEERSLLGDRLQGLRLPQRDLPESLDSARHLLDEVFQYHRRTHFTSEYMPKVDSSTMYYGLESRAPFLDHTLWEFAAGLSPEIRFPGRTAQGDPARNRAAAYRACCGIAP